MELESLSNETAIYPPSRLKSSEATTSSISAMTYSFIMLEVCQTLIIPSLTPTANSLPVGDIATDVADDLCPVNVLRSSISNLSSL